MSETWAFEPLYAPGTIGTAGGTLLPSTTITASVVAATNPVAFAGTNANQSRSLRVSNTTTSWAYVNVGVLGSVIAATVAASLPVAPGAVEVFTVSPEVNAASVILNVAPGANTAVTFTRGVGL